MKEIKTTIVFILLMVISISACGKTEGSDNSINETGIEGVTAEVSKENNTGDENAADEVVTETDEEIIMRPGHPTYYGSLEKAHEVWGDIETGRIHFGDVEYGHDDKPILTLDSSRDSDLIRTVLIIFDYFSEQPNYSLDDAVEIAASYMPFEIMEKYYEFQKSRMIAPDESREGDAIYYVISYHLTDEGKDAYDSKEHAYSGSIDVVMEAKDERIRSINISYGTPRWMGYLSKNEYHEEEWNCDLFDYR